MKRAGNLMEKICTLDNLYLAFYKASRGKRNDKTVVDYRNNLHGNIACLQKQLLHGGLSIGNYHYFTIYDPKIRLICAADFSERVVHHALMNVCHYYFERQLIYDTYATRPQKGIYEALERAKRSMIVYPYVAKLDVRKYFDSIAHDILLDKLQHIFKDIKLLQIFKQIFNSYHVEEKSGIPIGNLTSQYFANFYLSELDHFAKETLNIGGYYRYMDDILIFGDEKDELHNKITLLIEKAKYELRLSFKPHVITATKNGISFLGYKLFPHKILLNHTSKKRFMKNVQKINRYPCNETVVRSKLIAYLAFAKHAYSKKVRKKVLRFMDMY